MKRYILSMLVMLPCIAIAQFTSHTRLTVSDSISYTPFNNSHAIAVNGDNVHMVFTDRRDGAGEVYYKRSTDGGITWSDDDRLTEDDNAFSGRATIALWNNEIHLVWMDRRDGNNELYYARSTNNGNTWSDPLRLTTDGAVSEYPSLAVDFQALHLVWNDSRHGAREIYYKRSLNGGLSWTDDIRLTNNAGDSYKPSVAVVDTLVHVAWEDLRNGTSEIFYKHSDDNGMTWSDDLKLSNSLSNCFAPCISANGEYVFATWDDNRTVNSEVFGRRSIDGGNTWSAEANYSNSALESYSAYHAFSGTYMIMVYAEGTAADPDIHSRFSTDAGGSWSRSTPITQNASVAVNPFVAIAGAAIHAIWQDDLYGNDEILYSRNPNGNPFNHDHTLAYAHHLSSSQRDVAQAIIYDTEGNAYVTGSFSGTVDFDPGPDIFNITSFGSSDVFVYKLDPNGAFLWAKRIGGAETDTGFDIALDDSGNIVITGSFHTIVDFDPGGDIVTIGSLGQEDIFILKLNRDGNFIWVKRIGGTGRDEPQAVAINASNMIYVTGYYSEFADFDPGPNTVLQQSNGEEDIFIVSFTAAGDFSWAKSIGGTGFDVARDIDIDTAGQLTITGSFRNTADFDSGPGVQNLVAAGESDIFLLRMSDSGVMSWVHQFGDAETDEGYSVVTDDAGNIYTTGSFSNGVDFSPNGFYLLAAREEEDMYLLTLFPSGDFRWAMSYGGTGLLNGDEAGRALAVHDGFLYVTGTFEDKVDFQQGNKDIELQSSGGKDIFVQKLNTQNGALQWLNQFGGTMRDEVTSIAVVPYGKVALTGYFLGTADFSPTIDQVRFPSAGEEDGFVMVFRECEPAASTLEVTACSEYIYDETTTYSESGTYTMLLESSEGCDSVITLVLTILDQPSTSVIVSACESYTTPDGSHTWMQSGVYIDTIAASNGCDSIITYTLTIYQNSAEVITTSACDQYIDPEGNPLTASGVYEYHYETGGGCDSAITVVLTIYPSATSDTTIHACDFYTTPDGTHTWPTSGKYTYFTNTVNGCDSVVTINLFITDWETDITVTGNTLNAVNQFAEFQWVDCNNNFAPIFGENVSSFTPAESGSYAVIIGTGECYDTSACNTVVIVSNVEAGPLREASVFPNPANDRVQLTLPAGIDQVDVRLTDVFGRILMGRTIASEGTSFIDLPYPQGLYFIAISAGESQKTFRVLKI